MTAKYRRIWNKNTRNFFQMFTQHWIFLLAHYIRSSSQDLQKAFRHMGREKKLRFLLCLAYDLYIYLIIFLKWKISDILSPLRMKQPLAFQSFLQHGNSISEADLQGMCVLRGSEWGVREKSRDKSILIETYMVRFYQLQRE